MEASFLEIYQEHIHDLLCGEREREGRSYKIVQGECGRNDVSDLTFEPVRCQADVDRIMRVAEGNRTVARTDMNERSSRRCGRRPAPSPVLPLAACTFFFVGDSWRNLCLCA
jgi:hypothetical protein